MTFDLYPFISSFYLSIYLPIASKSLLTAVEIACSGDPMSDGHPLIPQPPKGFTRNWYQLVWYSIVLKQYQWWVWPTNTPQLTVKGLIFHHLSIMTWYSIKHKVASTIFHLDFLTRKRTELIVLKPSAKISEDGSTYCEKKVSVLPKGKHTNTIKH